MFWPGFGLRCADEYFGSERIGGFARAEGRVAAPLLRGRSARSIDLVLRRAYYTYVGVLERALDEFGLSAHLRPGMGHVIFTLFAEDDLTIREIAARSQLANSTLTGLLDRMEKGRLVERRRDAEDGRLVRVRLTVLGRSLSRACELVAAFDAIFQDRLGTEASGSPSVFAKDHSGDVVDADRDSARALTDY